MDINEIQRLQANLKEKKVRLIAVSKTHSVDEIKTVYDTGHRLFGENKVQELVPKYELLPKDIEWHFIGHLQKNKVKYIAPFIALIHSVDSLDLLKEINKRAQQSNRVIHFLFEIHIAREESKHGLNENTLRKILEDPEIEQLKNVNPCGLMGMATYTDDESMIRNEFRSLKEIFGRVKEKYFPDAVDFRELSMGMSGDYEIAIEAGSTMVRLGTVIFGEREYLQ